MDVLPSVREASASEPDAENLLSLDLLRLHGWRFDDGRLVGPSSWPGGDPGEAPTTLDNGEEGASPGRGGGTISRSEARREIRATRDYEDWAMEMRRMDLWKAAQERRALLMGRFFLGRVLAQPESVKSVRQMVAQGGDAAEIELWSEEDLRDDYGAAELGEGSTGAGG